MLQKLLASTAWAVVGLSLMSANMHLQTSADPYTGNMTIELPGETLGVNLNSPDVQFRKNLHGQLTFVSFSHMAKHYKVWFYLDDYESAKEKPRLVQRFEDVDGVWMLSGPVWALSPEGNITSESNWLDGKLHGPQRTFHPISLQLIEERFFDRSFPISEWRQLYSDGTVALSVTFPESRREWLDTFSAPTPDASGLLAQKFIDPIATTEVWFSQDGIKQAEYECQLYFDGADPVVKYTGHAKYYDQYGKVFNEKRLRRGTGTVSSWLRAEGHTRNQVQHWLGGELYKTSHSEHTK